MDPGRTVLRCTVPQLSGTVSCAIVSVIVQKTHICIYYIHFFKKIKGKNEIYAKKGEAVARFAFFAYYLFPYVPSVSNTTAGTSSFAREVLIFSWR